MKRLRALYNQLARIRFGFFTGCLTGVLACAYFVDGAARFSVPFETAVSVAFEVSGNFLGLVLLVRIFVFLLGILYRNFMSFRSCTMIGEPE